MAAPRFLDPMFRGPFAPARAEIDLVDCEVEGNIPADLAGTFYRVGPDFQYPPSCPTSRSMAKATSACFASRTATSTTRAATSARSASRPRPRRASRCSAPIAIRYTDDPRVKGVSRGTANTAVMFHHGKLLALKEDSPPVVDGSGHARDRSTTTTPSAASSAA